MSTTATPVTYGRDASIARFSVAGYQRMIETGILTPDDKVELLENYVVLKMPRNPPHDGTIDLINAALPRVLPSGWIVNLPDARIEVYTQPSGPVDTPDFTAQQTYGPRDDVPIVLDGNTVGSVPAAKLLP